MTDVLIKRELLERLAAPLPGDNGWQTWHTQEMIEASKQLRALLATPRQPEGEGLEVVASMWTHENGLKLPASVDRSPFYEGKGSFHGEPLCRLSDAQRAIAELRDRLDVMTQCADNYSRMFEESSEECERLRKDAGAEMFLTLTGEVTTLRRQLAELQDEAEQLKQESFEGLYNAVIDQRDKLAGLLREALKLGELDRVLSIRTRVMAALAEVNKWK